MSDGTPLAAAAPAQAEHAAGETRAELALTVEALQRKLAARHLVEKGLDMLKDSIGGYDGLHRGLDAIRANPIPVTLIGIGVTWMITERLSQAERLEAARRRVSDLASETGVLVSDGVAKLGLNGDSRSEGWTHSMVDMAQGALHSVRDSGEAMLDRASSYATDGAGQFVDQLRSMVQRHPLITGAVGFMAGLALATMRPATRTEDALLGSTSEVFKRRVRETTARAAGAATDAALGTVRDEVQTTPY